MTDPTPHSDDTRDADTPANATGHAPADTPAPEQASEKDDPKRGVVRPLEGTRLFVAPKLEILR